MAIRTRMMHHHLPVTTGKYDQRIWMILEKEKFLSRAKETDLRSRSKTGPDNLETKHVVCYQTQIG